MSDITNMDINIVNDDADLIALLQITHYYDGSDANIPQGKIPEGTTVRDIYENINRNISNYEGVSDDDYYTLNIVKSALDRSPELGDLKISNQTLLRAEETGSGEYDTSNMINPRTGLPYEDRTMYACTFVNDIDNPTDVRFAISGTGEARWVDNGKTLDGIGGLTTEQLDSVGYYNYVVQKDGLAYNNADIHFLSYSKGGSDAQAVLMESVYSDLINKGVYMFNSPGQAPETIEEWKHKLGEEEYYRRRDKLFLLAADNDPVNPLGDKVVSAEHTVYLKTNVEGIQPNIFMFHTIISLLNEDGTIIGNTNQGPVGQLMEYLSAEVMKLDPKDRAKVTLGLMWMIQTGTDRSDSLATLIVDLINLPDQGPVSQDVEYTFDDYESQKRCWEILIYALSKDPVKMAKLMGDICGLFGHRRGGEIAGVSISLFTNAEKFFSDNGWEREKEFVLQLSEIYDEYLRLSGKEPIHDFDYYDNLKKIAEAINSGRVVFENGEIVFLATTLQLPGEKHEQRYILNMSQFLFLAQYDLDQMKNRLNEEKKLLLKDRADRNRYRMENDYGYRYGVNNPVIVADTDVLRTYSSQIQSINERIDNVWSRLNRLCSRDSDRDLQIALAGINYTRVTFPLKRHSDYLRQAADKLEYVELKLSECGASVPEEGRIVPTKVEGNPTERPTFYE